MTTAPLHVITVHTPKFGKSVLHLSTSDHPMGTLLVAVSYFVWLPIGGTVSDRFGRRPQLPAITALAIGTTYSSSRGSRRFCDTVGMSLALTVKQETISKISYSEVRRRFGGRHLYK
jgi:MFS family permease